MKMKIKTILIGAGVLGVGWVLLKDKAADVTSKIDIGFQDIQFVDFWKNLVRLKLEIVTVMTVTNRNDFNIEVKAFDGDITYREESISKIKTDYAVVLESKVKQSIKFRFRTNILESAARVFLAFKDFKSIDGGRIIGTLTVKMKGVTVGIPYNEPTTINL